MERQAAPPHDSARPYRMRKRLDDVEETRRRIVEAAVELHGSVGPAHTTVSAVADTAGVQRSTVYRHFPDEDALFGACTSHWLARHPWPRPDDWRTEPDARTRLARGILDLYRYYERNHAMLSNSLRDISVMPRFVSELMQAQIASMHEALTEAWPEAADARAVSAGVAHALDFGSWQSLTRTGLTTDEAADLMASMVAAVAV